MRPLVCGRKDIPMSPDWLVLGLGRSGIGQQLEESRCKGMEDGKGEEILSEVPANGWLWLWDYVRRWRGCLSDIRATTSPDYRAHGGANTSRPPPTTVRVTEPRLAEKSTSRLAPRRLSPSRTC